MVGPLGAVKLPLPASVPPVHVIAEFVTAIDAVPASVPPVMVTLAMLSVVGMLIVSVRPCALMLLIVGAELLVMVRLPPVSLRAPRDVMFVPMEAVPPLQSVVPVML